MNLKVTVLMPIGWNPVYQQWIPEALESVYAQTYPADEILIIDDMAHLPTQWIYNTFDKFPERLRYVDKTTLHGVDHWAWEGPPKNREIWIGKWDTPWRLGFAAAFNCGVALAKNDLIVYLASDDKLMPDAIADCIEVYEACNRKDAWYALTYTSEAGDCNIPINAAMITKGLWRITGGYQPSAFAGPDAQLLSCMMVHAPDRIIQVTPGKVNYWIRNHPDQETKVVAQPFSEEMTSIRNKETARFKLNPEWAR